MLLELHCTSAVSLQHCFGSVFNIARPFQVHFSHQVKDVAYFRSNPVSCARSLRVFSALIILSCPAVIATQLIKTRRNILPGIMIYLYWLGAVVGPSILYRLWGIRHPSLELVNKVYLSNTKTNNIHYQSTRQPNSTLNMLQSNKT